MEREIIIKFLDTIFNMLLVGIAVNLTVKWIITIPRFLVDLLRHFQEKIVDEVKNIKKVYNSVFMHSKDEFRLMVFSWMLCAGFWNAFTNFSIFFAK